MDIDDDDRFDDRDLMELVSLAAYLEGKANRGLFPKARFNRYSGTLERLVIFLMEEISDTEISDEAALYFHCLHTAKSPLPSAKILSHPRFRGRNKTQ